MAKSAKPETEEQLPPAQVEANENEQESEEDSMPLLDKFTLLFALPSFLISLIVHIVLMAIAALIVFAGPKVVQVTLEASNSENVAVEELSLDNLELSDAQLETAELDQPLEDVVEPAMDMPIEVSDLASLQPMMSDIGSVVPNLDMMSGAPSENTSGFSQRTGQQQQEMAKKFGATAASEAAVELGLAWIAKHQLPDGGWDLDHTIGGGRFRQTPNPGRAGGRIGATALAILPFLGKGYTHMEPSKYQKTVRDGLAFLINNMRDEGVNGGSMYDQTGELYSHAIATICLCEAYGMTKNEILENPVKAAVKYTWYAQDPVGGGWRYQPQQTGDTSALGWQLMAMKSAQMMGMPQPPRVFDKATRFLNFVQANDGTEYGYLAPSEYYRPGTTSVGILCRMYLGWGKENPKLQKAIEILSERGPDTRNGNEGSQADMYYNYYATQIMRHYGDDYWEKWNPTMRDFLIESQNKEGFAAGSWYFRGEHASEVGGRLYTTAMAVMTLEVYYRHMPLYKKETLDEDFPLD